MSVLARLLAGGADGLIAARERLFRPGPAGETESFDALFDRSTPASAGDGPAVRERPAVDEIADGENDRPAPAQDGHATEGRTRRFHRREEEVPTSPPGPRPAGSEMQAPVAVAVHADSMVPATPAMGDAVDRPGIPLPMPDPQPMPETAPPRQVRAGATEQEPPISARARAAPAAPETPEDRQEGSKAPMEPVPVKFVRPGSPPIVVTVLRSATHFVPSHPLAAAGATIRPLGTPSYTAIAPDALPDSPALPPVDGATVPAPALPRQARSEAAAPAAPAPARAPGGPAATAAAPQARQDLGEPGANVGVLAADAARARVIDPRVGGEDLVKQLPVLAVDRATVAREKVFDRQAVGDRGERRRDGLGHEGSLAGPCPAWQAAPPRTPRRRCSAPPLPRPAACGGAEAATAD